MYECIYCIYRWAFRDYLCTCAKKDYTVRMYCCIPKVDLPLENAGKQHHCINRIPPLWNLHVGEMTCNMYQQDRKNEFRYLKKKKVGKKQDEFVNASQVSNQYQLKCPFSNICIFVLSTLRGQNSMYPRTYRKPGPWNTRSAKISWHCPKRTWLVALVFLCFTVQLTTQNTCFIIRYTILLYS